MKDLLVLMHRDRGQESRLAAALAVTRALDAHLTCLDVTIVPELAADYVTSGGGALLRADEERSEQANRAQMLPRLVAADIPYDWIDTTGDLTDALIDAAGLTDLIIVNRDPVAGVFPDMGRLTADLVLRARCPILAVCEETMAFEPTGHALVAWDGSPGAAAALRAAMPLLKVARHVTLLTVEIDRMKLMPERAASYCGRHGVHPVLRSHPRHGASVGEVIASRAAVLGVDYVVMGGFGHHPVREALFGGATRHMLRHSKLPLVLSHAS